MAKVAAQLTLDKTGKKSADSGFDAKNIVQYGFDCQGCDARQLGALFGATSLLASDGKTSQFSPFWTDAMSWYYSAMWSSHTAPNATAEASTQLAEGNSQASGAVAMNAAWIDSIGSIATDSKTSKVKRWDIGIVPSWNTATTSPMTADTFTITRASKNPDAAFKAVLAIMADASLLKAYGREPAKKADRPAYFTGLDAKLARSSRATRSLERPRRDGDGASQPEPRLRPAGREPGRQRHRRVLREAPDHNGSGCEGRSDEASGGPSEGLRRRSANRQPVARRRRIGWANARHRVRIPR